MVNFLLGRAPIVEGLDVKEYHAVGAFLDGRSVLNRTFWIPLYFELSFQYLAERRNEWGAFWREVRVCVSCQAPMGTGGGLRLS